MKIGVETQGGTTIVTAAGRLDFGASAGFQAQLEKLLAPAVVPGSVIVDCASLDYVSSAGLRVFLQAARAAQRAGHSFALCALRPAVREVLELSGFNRILTIHAGRTTAHADTAAEVESGDRISVAGDAGQLPVLTRFLQSYWSTAGLPREAALAFELALEEVFMNVVMHGSPAGAKRQVRVSLRCEPAGLAMTIEDDGPEFDPLAVPAPNLAAPLGERRVGGHGVSLVRQMMDAVGYQRIAGHNTLTMIKRVAP